MFENNMFVLLLIQFNDYCLEPINILNIFNANRANIL